MAESQLDYFRNLVRDLLVPRVIVRDDAAGVWRCDLCGTTTPLDRAPIPFQTTHGAGCRIQTALIVWE